MERIEKLYDQVAGGKLPGDETDELEDRRVSDPGLETCANGSSQWAIRP
jgi:hypothetical protein